MATVVNLNFGADDEGGEGQVYTADLILTSPYTEPVGNLLVLRSRPDIDPVDGTIAITESRDTTSFTGLTRLPINPVVGAFAVTARSDAASFTGTTAAYAVSGTLAVTVANDTASVVGMGYEGIAPRTGTLSVTEARDTATLEATYTPKWVATMTATEPGDRGSFSAWYLEYTGPGFLNTTERRDAASFAGRITYDVAATSAAVIESGDVAAIVGKTREVVEAESADTIHVSELLIGDAKIGSLVDRVWVTDILDYSRDLDFRDALTAADALASQLKVSLSRTETVYAVDELDGMAWGVTWDTVTVSDTLAMELRPHSLSDTVVAGAALTSYSAISGALVDTGYSADVLESGAAGTTTDTVQFTEALTGTLLRPTVFTDTVTVTEVLEAPTTVYAEVLTDAATATDGLTARLALVGVLADTVLAGDSLQEAAQTVYVVNAETGAVSTYQFTPTITGMAEYQGVLYLAGPDGLYALDAAQDDDGAVVWTLRTGFSNLGTDKLKRVRDANFQARTEAELTFQVVSDRYGQKQDWNYRLPALTRNSYRDGVVKPGLGIQSVYWQFAAQGIGPAEIDQLRLSVEPLSRRR